MADIKELTKLVEQAALAVTMADTSEPDQMSSLQKTLEQISKQIGQADNISSEIIFQAKAAADSSSELISQITKQQTDNAQQSLQTVSETVSALQQLTEQISKGTKDIEITFMKQEVCGQPDSIIIPEDDIPIIMEFINEAAEHIESSEAALLKLESHPGDAEAINLIFRCFHTIKGTAGFLNLNDIVSLSHATEELLDAIRKSDLVLTLSIIDVVFESLDMLKTMMVELKQAVEKSQPLKKQSNLTCLLQKLKDSITLNAEEDLNEDDDKALDEILTAQTPDETSHNENKNNNPQNSETGNSTGENEKIKVSTNRLDNLVNMVGELVIAQSIVTQQANNSSSSKVQLCQKISHQGRIVNEIQELSMSMRMVPIQGVFQKMARQVRDLSRKACKNINFETQGAETELDRNLVDLVADPLLHMVRNAVDHGIEPTAQRTKASKKTVGNIKLSAFHRSGNIVIKIEDDGRGLDKNQILKKAIDKGIVTPGQELSDKQIYKLIFHAGLSTAKKVTNISGRGVGMDVVKKNIESLHGKIEVDSTSGKGSTFTLSLPLTLAIIDGQLVKVAGHRYIIPLVTIHESFRPNQKQISSIQGRGEMVMVRESLLPIVRLSRLFNTEQSPKDLTETLLVIVESDEKKFCLQVDELLDQQQVVIKSLGDGFVRAKGISGAAIMGDGKPSLILVVPEKVISI